MATEENQAHAHRQARDAWWAVGSIAAGTFLLVTIEFLPIGLLSRLAGDLKVSEGVAGLSVAALVATALVLLAGRLDRRLVMVALTAAIVASNLQPERQA